MACPTKPEFRNRSGQRAKPPNHYPPKPTQWLRVTNEAGRTATQTHVTTNTIGGLNVTPTPIDVDRLETELVEHPNRTFVSTLVTGLRLGFYTGINNLLLQNLECPNNRSAKAQPKIVNQLTNAEVKKGFLVGPFKKPPFSLYRVSPLGLAEGTYPVFW